MDQMDKENNNLGIVKISDEVIGVISAIAASEIDGIVDADTKSLANKLKGKKHIGKSVKVNMEADAAVIEIAVVVKYGINIPETVMQVQENIKRTVEAITGLSIKAVNVVVQNIIISKNEEENEIKER
ncbi:Asp23/Gls24 family envelope stress response protein [uncultured Clostridium sp.]|uniref:Asp23/Gls24 family envelope stress response protein n=1 Tax=uncultured Clostridium sp. TaxID=59620 RepID=UPI0026038DF6|nr:Asp23/Gls24 family envelope stress response protein [uncultured Clostridium sp.]